LVSASWVVVAGALTGIGVVLPQAAVDSATTTPHTPSIARVLIVRAPLWIVA
jgi:hypothetical protein